MAQERIHHQKQGGGDGGEDAGLQQQAQQSSTAPSADLDGLLDEIDTVLEANAEEFVKGFVQKGGQ
ncbi:Prokaryotic ubiquitin-like protein Pup [Micrococcus lylae]|uniref:Prokaryotic ubiquitin-like protein Pup n=1 Tax=Micrococcus lylae TaxID=1273 RepID=A0A1R4I9P1_9MICC|nr:MULTISPECIES: ubiquitin-like protein Pup [Micrococcus]MCT2008078.1 ubiquitin-like protein Pup [Micrococcus lylae]MCT2071878.1 ubiquitin-like protein Pup [Micrococcus lylae]OFR86666.1 ubiquitin [Micrococcus sp. HMSC067E09]PNL18023.1 ubiquitin-like protein Pup [Micrococcus sp. FDAARGOS_333]TFH98061.1 ubiquitin-like protein Pup [Micrococcus lylae]